MVVIAIVKTGSWMGGPCISDVWESLVANNLHLRKWFEMLEMDSGNQDVVPLGPRVVR